MPQFSALSRDGTAAQSNAFADSNRNAHELKYIGDVPQKFEYKVQKHTKHTLFCVFLGRDSGVQHCVSNLVKEHSSRATRLIFRDVAFNDDNVVYPELAA